MRESDVIKFRTCGPEVLSAWRLAIFRTTAIREGCSMNLEAVEEMADKFRYAEIIFIRQGGGDNPLGNIQPRSCRCHNLCNRMWAQGEKIP